MKHKFKNGTGKEIEISQTNRKEWVPYLLLVLTNPHRLLGICTQNPHAIANGEPIKLGYVCVYASQIGFQQAEGQRGVKVMGNRFIIPFDGVAPFRKLTAYNYTGLSWIEHEPEESPLRGLLVDGYVNIFNPSQLVMPTPDIQKKILDS